MHGFKAYSGAKLVERRRQHAMAAFDMIHYNRMEQDNADVRFKLTIQKREIK
jgi:hypothetical protein